MLASEMISTIKMVEKECHGITQMYSKRISIFQSENLPLMQGVQYDSAFEDFVAEIESVMECKIYIPTAKKILNNWYLWAQNNLDALSKLEPLKSVDNMKDNIIDWVIKNDFRIDHKAFAEIAREEFIEKIETQMPKNSELYFKLKSVADKKCIDEIGERGFSYSYLVKAIAGFSEFFK